MLSLWNHLDLLCRFPQVCSRYFLSETAMEGVLSGRKDFASSLVSLGFVQDSYVASLDQIQGIPINADADEFSTNARIVKAAICAGQSLFPQTFGIKVHKQETHLHGCVQGCSSHLFIILRLDHVNVRQYGILGICLSLCWWIGPWKFDGGWACCAIWLAQTYHTALKDLRTPCWETSRIKGFSDTVYRVLLKIYCKCRFLSCSTQGWASQWEVCRDPWWRVCSGCTSCQD